MCKKILRRSRQNAKASHEKGLTLVELLIVIAISALIIIALLSLYIAGQKYFFNQSAKADTIEDSRMPMAWISRDIRDATEVLATSPSGTYTTGVNVLVLEVPSVDATGQVISGSFDAIVYRQDPTNPNRLERTIELETGSASSRQAGTRVLADNVSGFVLLFFKEDGITAASPVTDTFIVDVTLISSKMGIQRGNQPFVESLNTRAKLRNKVLPT
jgi:Tfp pilus assembly protein FimT